jgi:hypothetical protein
MAEKKERKPPAKKERRKRREATPQLGDMHEMPDGTVMTGKKHSAKSKDVPLKKVTKADIAEIRKSIPKKKKIKKKPPLVDGKVQRKKKPVMIGDKPLTVTRADGSVRVLTKKDRKGNSAYGR